MNRWKRRLHRLWIGQEPGCSAEATAELERLVERDAEVEELGVELRARQRINGFGAMVAQAIARTEGQS